MPSRLRRYLDRLAFRPVNRPRLIAADLDGTLLDRDSHLSARTISALTAAADAGIDVIAVTGRSHRTTVDRLTPAATLSVALCSNGAVHYDLKQRRVVSATMLTRDRIDALFAAVSAAVPDARFGWESHDGFGFDDGFAHHPVDIAGDPSLRLGPQHRERLTEAIKIYIAHPTITDVALQRRFAGVIPDGVDASTSGAPFIEATASEATKGAAVAAYAASAGIERSDVMAFGDQMNDRSMLTWAGTAVAMGNARDEIKAIADIVAAPHDEDGVARVIEMLLS